MADFKISQLDAMSAGDISRNDVIIVNEGDATTKKATLTSFFGSDQVKDLIAGGDGTGSNEIDDLYVKLAGDDSNVQTITGTAGLKTAGLLESAGGVKVSGGTAAIVGTGIYNPPAVGDADILAFGVDSQQMMFITDDGGFRFETKGNGKTFHVTGDVDLSSAGEPIVFHYAPTFTGTSAGATFVSADVCINDGSIENLTHYYSEAIKSGSGSFNGEEVLFSAESIDTNAQADNIIGFKSNVSTTVASETYNFYASGDAPNYFEGNTLFNADTDAPGFGNNSIGTCINTATNRFFISTAGQAAMELNRNDAGIILAFRTNGGINSSGDVAGAIYNIDETSSKYDCGLSTKDNGFVSSSDYRLKENIADITDATTQVKQLKPRTFNWIGKSETVQGFVAHELQEVNTFYATGTKDEEEAIGTLADYDGTVLQTEVAEPPAEDLTYTEETTDSEGVTRQNVRTRTWTATGTRPVYQGVDQTKLIPLLTKALQEALDRIEALENA